MRREAAFFTPVTRFEPRDKLFLPKSSVEAAATPSAAPGIMRIASNQQLFGWSVSDTCVFGGDDCFLLFCQDFYVWRKPLVLETTEQL